MTATIPITDIFVCWNHAEKKNCEDRQPEIRFLFYPRMWLLHMMAAVPSRLGLVTTLVSAGRNESWMYSLDAEDDGVFRAVPRQRRVAVAHRTNATESRAVKGRHVCVCAPKRKRLRVPKREKTPCQKHGKQKESETHTQCRRTKPVSRWGTSCKQCAL